MDNATLYKLALRASELAYAPYSKLRVGVAVLLSSGEVVCGANQENVSYSLTLCAERVALARINMEFPEAIVSAIAVATAGQVIAPCGACRQVLYEQYLRQGKSDFEVIISDTQSYRITELLPLPFDSF